MFDNPFSRVASRIDIEARLAVNGVGPTDVAASIWNTVAHHFYERPHNFARDFAAYIGEKRDYTEEQVDDLRWRISETIAPHDPQSDTAGGA